MSAPPQAVGQGGKIGIAGAAVADGLAALWGKAGPATSAGGDALGDQGLRPTKRCIVLRSQCERSGLSAVTTADACCGVKHQGCVGSSLINAQRRSGAHPCKILQVARLPCHDQGRKQGTRQGCAIGQRVQLRCPKLGSYGLYPFGQTGKRVKASGHMPRLCHTREQCPARRIFAASPRCCPRAPLGQRIAADLHAGFKPQYLGLGVHGAQGVIPWGRLPA